MAKGHFGQLYMPKRIDELLTLPQCFQLLADNRGVAQFDAQRQLWQVECAVGARNYRRERSVDPRRPGAVAEAFRQVVTDLRDLALAGEREHEAGEFYRREVSASASWEDNLRRAEGEPPPWSAARTVYQSVEPRPSLAQQTAERCPLGTPEPAVGDYVTCDNESDQEAAEESSVDFFRRVMGT